MADAKLVIGNKNYSSWSLRAWLMAKAAELAFDEVLIPLDEAGYKAEIRKHSPSGRVPTLIHNDLVIWDSLAIGEYLAETFPNARLWPTDPSDRAVARAVSAEMHSGFESLRRHMPMNIRSRFPEEGRKPGVQDDINRIKAIWRSCRDKYGAGGPFLFGDFGIVDAMFAPVASRFRTFQVELGDTEQAYCDALMKWPDMKAWADAAENEPMIIDSAEF